MKKLICAVSIFVVMIAPSAIADEVIAIGNNTQQTTQDTDALNLGNSNNQQAQSNTARFLENIIVCENNSKVKKKAKGERQKAKGLFTVRMGKISPT